MSNKDIQRHLSSIQETGRFKLKLEQEETINALMGDLVLELGDSSLRDDPDCTMDLPILAKKGSK